MEDDYSDILGSGVLNIKPQSGLPFGVKASLWICTLGFLYIIGVTAWKNFLRWRELSYRLAMRRRHGIPDDDHRPFNVAYAAVQNAREKREALRRAKSRPMSNTAREQPPSSAQLKQDLRQRTGPARNVEATWTKDRAESLPRGYRHSTTAGSSRYNPVNNGQQPVLQNEEKVLYPRATELVTSANHPMAASVRISKIQSDSKRRNYAYMDIDQGSLVADRLRSSDTEPLERATFKRGSKREYGDADETEDVLESKRVREKRARKVSLEKAILDEEMEVDENEFEDENTDCGQVSRGKKRDREEAGSTFGGDDEDRSESEDAEDDTTTRRRSRKRRSVAKRKSDLATITRGKKRDRDIDEETSDEGSDRGYAQTSARKRRNKKEGISDEDVSMEESPAKGKGRKIGEEWTSNGVLCKIGPNGQRLRQALVKKARQKYHMPKDSQHPDRDANLEVYVETWLTEEEYQNAKARHSLAWQDTPKASVERDTHEVAQPPPSPVGKSLLWKSTATPPATTPDGGSPTSEFSGSAYRATKGRISYDPRRQSIAVDVATRVNPFHQYPAQASKRIASGNGRASSAGLVDSTNSSPRTGQRMYSKWEKQDLEANAMMKMREVARKKENEEKERQEKERQEKERIEREKAEKDKASIPSVPIITVTEPAEDKPAGIGIPSFFARPAVSAKDAANSPVAIPSPVSLPGFFKSGEKTTTPTESKASPFPSATPAATPFTFGVPGSSPFAPVAKPTVDSTKSSEQPKPPPFAPPQPLSVTSTPNPAPATSAPSFFSFPKSSAVPEPQNSEQNGQVSGPSLLSRLGPDAAPATSLQPSTFSFTKPTEAPKSFFTPTTTTSSLTAQPPASTSTTSSMSTGAAGSSALKFDFKVANKPLNATTATPASTAPDASKPGSGASIFSFKPTTVPPAESNAGAGGAAPFKFVFSPQTAKDAGGTKEDNGAQGSKQTLTFSGFNTPASKPASSSVFSNAGAATSQPGFGTTGTSSEKSGASSFSATTAPSGSMISGANKTTGFSAFSNASSTLDSSSKPSVFGSFASASGTTAFGSFGGTTSFNAPKPTDGTNSAFTFGKTSTAPASTPTTTTSTPSNVPNHHSSFTLNDISKAQNSSNAPSTSTNSSFPVNRTPLNKTGASEGTFSTPTNPFQTASGSGANPTATVFGAGGQPASNSASSSLFGALGGSGQSASNVMASSAPSGANAASTLGAPSQSIFGSTSNSTSTPTPFGQSAFPTTNTSQFPLGAPSGQPAPSSAPTTTPSIFGGGSSIFGSATTTKPGTSPFGAFGNTSQSTNNSIPPNSASAIQFGQSSMSTPNNTGGQS
ncbi:hypothetical protein JOM56_008894 [Amanita muscaria]